MAYYNKRLKPDNRLVSVTASTVAVSKAAHDGVVIALNRAAGITATLPPATGSGALYTFVVGTTFGATGNGIIACTTTDVMQGVVTLATDTSGLTVPTTATSDKMTMNGSTTGGVHGSTVRFLDVKSGTYAVEGAVLATGAESTPFAAS